MGRGGRGVRWSANLWLTLPNKSNEPFKENIPCLRSRVRNPHRLPYLWYQLPYYFSRIKTTDTSAARQHQNGFRQGCSSVKTAFQPALLSGNRPLICVFDERPYIYVRLKPTIDKIIPRGQGLWGIFYFSPFFHFGIGLIWSRCRSFHVRSFHAKGAKLDRKERKVSLDGWATAPVIVKRETLVQEIISKNFCINFLGDLCATLAIFAWTAREALRQATLTPFCLYCILNNTPSWN